MPRLTKDQWSQARELWESDPTQTDESIAEKFGVSKSAVVKARTQGKDSWKRAGSLLTVQQRAQFVADLKSNRQSDLGHFKSTTIDAAVEIRAKLLEQHREDWKEHREQFTLPDIAANFELGKSAKITAEMLKIRQEGERKAYGLDEQQPQQGNNANGEMKVTIVRAKRHDAAEE